MKKQQSFDPDRKSYAYLEGIRGLSALYVVFFHIWQATTMGAEPGLGLRIGLGWAVGGGPGRRYSFQSACRRVWRSHHCFI